MQRESVGQMPAAVRPPMPVSTCSQIEVCAACPSRETGFCSQIDLRALDRLSQQSVRMPLDAHDVLGGGDFYIIIRGVLQSVHHDIDGNRRIVGLVLPGEAIDGAKRNDQFEYEAANPAMVCRVQAANMRRALADSHSLRLQVHAVALTQLDRLRHLRCALAVLHPDERIAGFLLECATFLPWQPLPGGGGILTMTLERADIADLMGTTVETVCRVLRRFDRDGLIRMHDARNLEIPDLALLRRRAVLGGLEGAVAAGAVAASAAAVPATLAP